MKNQETIWNSLYSKGLFWKKSTLELKNIIIKKSVLELGVGNGKTLKSILNQNPKQVVALDISGEAIKISEESIKSNKVIYIKSDIFKLDIREKFDVVFCYYFLNNFKKRRGIEVINKIKSLLKSNGTILFEDFATGDFRENKYLKKIEENTIQKKNGLICHFFEKKEIFNLFKDFRDIKIEEKTFSPIRTDKAIRRRILKAVIRN
ncbi:MAG: class I SAM-dependent methyltransferase [Nanoarchaeota archaeon]